MVQVDGLWSCQGPLPVLAILALAKATDLGHGFWISVGLVSDLCRISVGLVSDQCRIGVGLVSD